MIDLNKLISDYAMMAERAACAECEARTCELRATKAERELKEAQEKIRIITTLLRPQVSQQNQHVVGDWEEKK